MHVRTKRVSLAGLVVLIGTFALLLSACGGSTANNGPADKAKDQTLKMTWSGGGGSQDVTTLDPAVCYDTSCSLQVALVFDTLVTLDKNLKVIPWAAKSWDIQDGGKTFVFHLQPNQKFSDGTPVKASDFAWSIDRQFNPAAGGTFCTQGTSLLFLDSRPSGIVGSDAYSKGACSGNKVSAGQTLIGNSIIPDDSANTLTIKLSAPSAYFLPAMTLPFSAAVEKSAIGDKPDVGADFSWRDNLAKGATGQGGSGMYYVSKWDHNGTLDLKPNPNWWGVSQGKKPGFSEIDFTIFESSDTQYSTYQSDQSFAFSGTIPPDQIAAAKGQQDYTENPRLSTESVGLNFNIAPFNDINARKAFCLALNRDQINQSVFKGSQHPEWNLVPPGIPGYNNPSVHGIDNAPTSGDVAKAQQYLAQYKASLNGKPIPAISLSFNVSSNSQKLLAEAYQATWKAAFPDANISINVNPWAKQVPLLFSGKLQLSRSGWVADYPDPETFLSELYKTGSGNNSFNSSVPTADTLLNQADAMTDPGQQQQRMQLYYQAEQQLIDNVAVCPVYSGVGHSRIRTWVKNFKLPATGGWTNDEFLEAYIANH
jgi:oligopeptide transport system substrate-binding protein